MKVIWRSRFSFALPKNKNSSGDFLKLSCAVMVCSIILGRGVIQHHSLYFSSSSVVKKLNSKKLSAIKIKWLKQHCLCWSSINRLYLYIGHAFLNILSRGGGHAMRRACSKARVQQEIGSRKKRTSRCKQPGDWNENETSFPAIGGATGWSADET